jgi:hypothetical protein
MFANAHSCLVWVSSYDKYECVIVACIINLYVLVGLQVSLP